jgi:Flp pilus assembly protein CpaB
MRIPRNARLLLVALGLLALGLGVWQVAGAGRQTTMVRVLAASRDLPAGSVITPAATTWQEVAQLSAGAYLQDAPKTGSLMLSTVAAGELIPNRAVGVEPFAGRSVVTLKPAVLPVRTLQVGDIVDVWVQHSANSSVQSESAPTLIATEAEVVAISAEQGGFSSGSQRVDLSVERSQIEGLVSAALGAQNQLAVVRSASMRDVKAGT